MRSDSGSTRWRDSDDAARARSGSRSWATYVSMTSADHEAASRVKCSNRWRGRRWRCSLTVVHRGPGSQAPAGTTNASWPAKVAAELDERRRNAEREVSLHPLRMIKAQREAADRSHVMADQKDSIEFEGFENADQVCEHSVSGVSIRRCVGPPCATQVWADHAIVICQRRDDLVPFPPMLRK